MRSLADDIHWAVNECADTELGDLRRTKRVVELATALAQHPAAPLPAACGTGAMLKAPSRFFANDTIEPQDLLHSHSEATYRRLCTGPVGLAVHDTTAVDWTAHPATQGLGPLGVLAQQVWVRDPNDRGKHARRKPLPSSQQESHTWLTSLEAVCTAHDACPATRLVRIGDREADV